MSLINTVCEPFFLQGWDGELVKQADEWATCEHVTELSIPVPRQSIFHRYGANLLSRFRSRNTSDDVGSFIKTAVRGWFDEGRHFDVHSSACLPGHSCERYTQVGHQHTTNYHTRITYSTRLTYIYTYTYTNIYTHTYIPTYKLSTNIHACNQTYIQSYIRHT